MPLNAAEITKRTIIGRRTEWIKRFNISEYVGNKPMIEKLFEEKQLALLESFDLRDRVRDLEINVHEMELNKQRLEIQLNEANRRSHIVFILTLVAAVLIGLGVNIATSNPSNWSGWVMIVSACVLEIIAFFAKPKKSEQ